MKNLNSVAADLFNKIRGRFPSVTIGDSEGTVTTVPEESRFYDFAFTTEGAEAGKVSISLDEENGVTVIVGKDITENQPQSVKSKWFDFLRELRQFARKRMLQFDVRDITKSNLQKRDYKHLAATRPGENTMAESKMYGTNRTSYQRIGNARLAIKHTAPINTESSTGRTQKIGSIFVESPDGEKFRYPFVHLSGARAMARHVSEGGNAYDDFGKYISGLSEELSKLRKFNTYMNRSGVMAETLGEYTDIVKERSTVIRKEIQNLQKEGYYRSTVEGFSAPIVEDVPEDVAENWIDQLTIRQFNEELKDVFPYIYRLVGEATRARELGPEDLDESGLQYYTGVKKHGKEYMKKAAQAGREGASQEELGRLKDKYSKAAKKTTKEEFELEQAFEDAMGQFSDHVCEECGNPSWRTLSETEKQKGLDGKVCWKGYKRMGTKMKGGKRVDNCVKIKEAEDGTYMRQWYEDGKDYGALELFVNGKMVDAWDEDFNPNEPGNPLQKEFVKLAKKNGVNPIGLKVLDMETGRKGVFTSSGIKWNSTEADDDRDTKEGNAFAHAVRQAKMNGKKKGDKIQGPDGDEITLEKDYNFSLGFGEEEVDEGPFKGLGKAMMKHKLKKDMSKHDDEMDADLGWAGDDFVKAYDQKQRKKKALSRLSRESEPLQPEKPKTPLGEFILSYFDRETGKFPKGQTAVLTAVEKDYGDEYVEPARQFIEQVEATTLEYLQQEASQSRYPETEMIKRLAGM